MKKPIGAIEIYLQPGDFYFGNSKTRIGTLLGSCVSITMWHPVRLIGGMCHFMLPSRNLRTDALQGKYADEAMEMFHMHALRSKTVLSDYQIKLFGGGNMFPEHTQSPRINISGKNVEAAHTLLAKYKLQAVTQDLGLTGHRRIIFDIWNGNVWVRYQPLKEPQIEGKTAKTIAKPKASGELKNDV